MVIDLTGGRLALRVGGQGLEHGAEVRREYADLRATPPPPPSRPQALVHRRRLELWQSAKRVQQPPRWTFARLWLPLYIFFVVAVMFGMVWFPHLSHAVSLGGPGCHCNYCCPDIFSLLYCSTLGTRLGEEPPGLSSAVMYCYQA